MTIEFLHPTRFQASRLLPLRTEHASGFSKEAGCSLCNPCPFEQCVCILAIHLAPFAQRPQWPHRSSGTAERS
jgi:hypothetical protein